MFSLTWTFNALVLLNLVSGVVEVACRTRELIPVVCACRAVEAKWARVVGVVGSAQGTPETYGGQHMSDSHLTLESMT